MNDRGSRPFLLAFSIGSFCFGVSRLGVAAQDSPSQNNPSTLAAPVSSGFDLGTIGYSWKRQLLGRSDVQTHLRLSLRQKEALDLNPLSPEEKQHRLQQRAAERARSGKSRFIVIDRNAPPEEREEREQEFRAVMRRLRDQERKQIETVLTEAQQKRLNELDLQWRGPAALGDPTVAKQVELSEATYAKVLPAARDYFAQRGAAVRAAVKKERNIVPPEAIANKLSPLGKTMNNLDKTSDARILTLLLAEERARWTAAQGKPFAFRTDLK